MFYLEVKDGDRFFTDTNSDDKKEFEKIINDKLGRDAADFFDVLVRESEENAENFLLGFSQRYKECVNKLDKTLNADKVDPVKLHEILSDFQSIYLDYLL